MIELSICAKCPRCNGINPSKYQDGRLIRLPYVECDGITLAGNDELPPDCLYILEQKILEEQAIEAYESLKEELEEDEHTSEV